MTFYDTEEEAMQAEHDPKHRLYVLTHGDVALYAWYVPTASQWVYAQYAKKLGASVSFVKFGNRLNLRKIRSMPKAQALDGCNTAGIDATNFVHVVVSKEPPHECAVYEVGQESIDLGREENQRTLEELALRIDRQDWSGRWSSDLTTVNLPYWRFNRRK